MKLQRQLIAVAIAGGVAVGAASTVAAQRVYVIPEPQQPVVIYQEPNVYVARTVVPEYTYNPLPAPEIVVGLGATDTSNVYMYKPYPYRVQPGFTLNTSPGYFGERNVRP